MIRLAALDMAGTTVADGGTVEAAFVEAAAGGGIEPGTPAMDRALEYVRATMGQSKIEVFRALFPGDEAAAQAANEGFEAAYGRQVRAGGVASIPGAGDAIDELRAAGVLVCLTTGFAPPTRQALLDALGWGDRIDLALSPADAGRGRPWPDMILTAVLRLGIDDVRQVAVAGDTANDLLAGWRAGAAIVAGVLTGAHDRATLAAAPHTHILESVAELPVIVAHAGLPGADQ
jgi:phosphoglycolate phosphatase